MTCSSAIGASSLFLFLLIVSSFATAATSSTIRIHLSKPPSSSGKPWESISLLASSSLIRARHLKQRLSAGNGVKTSLYPRSYGGYSVRLSLGTPPQNVSMVMDTGSSLVWTPCTTSNSSYSCQNCTFSGVDPAKILTYYYNKSSTVQPVSCKSPKCGWVFGSTSGFNCTSQQLCPGYSIEYGLGSTAGLLVTDTVDLSDSNLVKDFLFGCSLISERQPEGIAGFGRGSDSIPAQLGLTKFSYCMVSHSFDDSNQGGDLVLYGGRAGAATGAESAGVSYAPFRTSPPVSPYSEYYYIALEKILVGGNNVPLTIGYLVPSAKGEGGVIVDSGSTFTFMEKAIHDPVASEFEKQMGKYKRAEDIEAQSGLGPCYNITGEKDVEIPKLVLLFMGGARMDLPLANYFSFIGGSDVVCMTFLTDTESPAGTGIPSGPAMILGNYQQQNFYVEYDLENKRFGFKPQQCAQGGGN